VSRLIKIAAGLAFASVGLAAPAHADANQDQRFYRLLTDPDQSHPMVIWNFALMRSLGILSCQREDAGETPYQATKDLQYPNGPYNTFEDANSVSSAAETIYCPWHTAGLSTPAGLCCSPNSCSSLLRARNAHGSTTAADNRRADEHLASIHG
jgi:hypothetical protein